MLKRFPLKARLSVTFGLLFVVSMTIINIISIRSSRLTLEKQAASQPRNSVFADGRVKV